MRKVLSILSLFVLLFCCEAKSESERKPWFYFGGALDLGINIHWADFNRLQDIPNCCPKFRTTTGVGWNLALLFQRELHMDWQARLRLGFDYEGIQFKENEFIGNTPVKYVTDLNQIVLVPVNVEHTLKPKLYGIYLEPSILYNVYDNLWLNLGLNLTQFVLTKVDQKEEIVSPDNIVFIDGSRIRNQYNDLDIPSVKKLYFRPLLGISYNFKVFGDAFISPEVRFAFPLNNISNVDWKVSYINIGATIRFPVYPPPEIHYYYDTVYVRDTSTVAILGLKESRVFLTETKATLTEKKKVSDGYLFKTYISEKYTREVPKLSQLSTDIKVLGRSRQGEIQENPTLTIEELETEEMFPLLPYVFFPEGSANLDSASVKLVTKDKTKEFDENNLSWNTLAIYSELLNIIGKRLKQNPSAKLTLVGCNSNTGVEAKNTELSQRRAESVKSYLVNVWGIKPERISVKFRNLPEKFTNPTLPEGRAENQRVEIYSTDWEILKPVRLSRIQRTSNPPIIEIIPSVQSDSPVESWGISVEQSGSVLRQFTGTETTSNIIWNVEEEPIPRFEEPVEISFYAKDILGQKDVSKKSLKIEQKTIKKKREELLGDKKIERFSLIVFDFDKAEILPQQIPILNEIKKKIADNSRVIIAGYTDRIGEPSYNKDLARRRCLVVQKFLGLPDEKVELQPVGSDVLLFDNDLPQGRSYCRTVQIIIETPIK
jgi:outer membrane protein OmpA-like peptidoglycan-associated protein